MLSATHWHGHAVRLTRSRLAVYGKANQLANAAAVPSQGNDVCQKLIKTSPGDGGSNIVGQVTEQLARLRARMECIRSKVAVVSGKGGVGKSAITVNLATAVAMEGAAVGILDADLNGPSIAKMTGVRGQRLVITAEGVQPAQGPAGMRIMSMDLLLPHDDTPVIWQAMTPDRCLYLAQ